LEFQQDAKDIQVKGNHTNLCQVLLNLAINARDAMPNGGRLRIQSAIKDDAFVKRKFDSATSTNGFVVMSISDTGGGIPEEVRLRMFEPFYTTKGKGKGTGLGLSIVHGVVKAHNGMIDVQTEIGKGTTFSIYLPLLEKVEEDVQNQPIQTKGYLLLVEDEMDITNFLAEYLENEGYTVFKAFDGAEAAEIYKQHKNQIDLVITDSDLPKMTGRELIGLIRQINPNLPIIIASGSLGIREFSAKMQGKIAFIQKPYAFSQILSQLQNLTN
jgi:CheY-like chemotaxis protein